MLRPSVLFWKAREAAVREEIAKAQAQRVAGIEQGVHILRHTFCSHLAMKGAPARAIQELARHADLSTTQPYMHLSPAATEDAIRLPDGHHSDHGPAEAGHYRSEDVDRADKLETFWTRKQGREVAEVRLPQLRRSVGQVALPSERANASEPTRTERGIGAPRVSV